MNLNEIHLLQKFNNINDIISIIGLLFKMGMASYHR